MSRARTRTAIAVGLLPLLVLSVPATASASLVVGVPVRSPDLVEDPQRFDGSRVVFEGEAISGPMVRGEHAWIHLNDDPYATGSTEHDGYNSGQAVWLDASLIQAIEHYGDYDTRGDVVRVAGTFSAADPAHGGDMDIHADSLEVVRTGGPVEHDVGWWKSWLVAALGIVAAVCWAVRRRHLQTTPERRMPRR